MKKLIGGIFLITGTAVGGGIVLLPAIIGVYGYWSAMILLILVWLMNVLLAFIFLEANFYLPLGSSMISMTKVFLGKHMQWITWVLCLIFLYTLLCAYISGVSEIIHSFFQIPTMYTSLLSILVISILIFLGVNYLSSLNEFIVLGMFILLIVLLCFLGQKTHTSLIFSSPYRFPLMTLPVVSAAFGFTVVVPSIRIYFNNDIKQLKRAFLIGTSIPVVLYMAWTTVVMGLIPGFGDFSLQSIVLEEKPIQSFKSVLVLKSSHASLIWMIEAFIFTALASSLVGLSISTYDFLADGLKIRKNMFGKLKLLLITFLPTFFITTTQSRLFLKALGVAGLLSVLVFGVLPLIFVWLARYKYNMTSAYKTPFSKPVFLILFISCLTVIAVELLG